MGVRRYGAKAAVAIASFRRLPYADQWIMLRLLAEIAAIEVLLRVQPLPRVARLLGVAFAEEPWSPPVMAPPALTEDEQRQLRCVRRIVRRWRFCEGTCLRESLLAGHILRRRRPRLMIGVTHHDGSFAAHAWLDVGGRTIGKPGVFQPLGCVSPLPR